MFASLTRSRFLMLVISAPVVFWAAAPAQQPHYSSEHRQAERPLAQQATTTDARMKRKLALGRSGVSLVGADFDSDGTQDLISGYSAGASGVLLLQRGSALAMAPGPNEHALLAAGESIAPYAERAEAIDVPVRPDLLKAADIAGHGHFDLITAAKGENSVYVLTGDGRGN